MMRAFSPRPVSRLEALVWTATVVLLCAPDALAWGPATHSLFTSLVLEGALALPAAVLSLLRRFRLDFLYGSLAPDVIVAKSFCAEEAHCHRWSNGFKVLEAARDDASRAFALGYLTHLAADVVAHNRFVPERIPRLRLPAGLAHAYIEMRADDRVDYAHWDAPRAIGRERERRHDRLLDTVLTMTLLPYGTNKAIFTGLARLAERRSYRALLRIASDASKRLPISDSEIAAHHGESLRRIESILGRLERSEALSEDPTGRDALAAAVGERQRERARRRGDAGPRASAAFLALRALGRRRAAAERRSHDA
jgi:hypothetical protein